MNLEALTLATSELWCLAPGHALAASRASANAAPRGPAGGVVAVVEISGALEKPFMVQVREKVANYANSDSIGEIILLVDSPGGTVSRTHDLHTTIARAAKRKRVTAVIEDCACSGALYAVAGASEIVIGETAVTGSIGVYQVHIDQSKLLEKIGVEVIVISTGNQKGAGISGAKLTPAQYEHIKRRVEIQAKHFINAVATGRRMSVKAVSEIADGRIFIGSEAVAAGLADRVGMFDDVLAEAGQRATFQVIENLTGPKAIRQFAELVVTEAAGDADKRFTSAERVRARYPKLTAAVRERTDDVEDVLEELFAERKKEDAVTHVADVPVTPYRKRLFSHSTMPNDI